jgi:hypothetical protein
MGASVLRRRFRCHLVFERPMNVFRGFLTSGLTG